MLLACILIWTLEALSILALELLVFRVSNAEKPWGLPWEDREGQNRKKNPFTKEPCKAMPTWRERNSANDAQLSLFIFHSTSDAAQNDGLEKLISFGWKIKPNQNVKEKAGVP